MPIKLVANPSKTGWTTQEALDSEISVLKTCEPNFATLQIGVNDWVQGVSAAQFRKSLVLLIDRMLAILPDHKSLLLVTIPDFSVTPAGASFGTPEDIASGMSGFNEIIKQEAASRHLPVVDIFSLSQRMRDAPALTAPDGLHPSAKEYDEWEKVIQPSARALLVS